MIVNSSFEQWIYLHNEDNSARYVLGEHGSNMLACFGINTSTAAPNQLDPTLTQVQKRAQMHGYNGWLMFNVYPQRATNPNDMHRIEDPLMMQENLQVIQQFLGQYPCDIWAAWGSLIDKRSYLKKSLLKIYQVIDTEHRWLHIGKPSKKGHPHHPLYLSHNFVPEVFDIKAYIDDLCVSSNHD